MNPTPDDKIRQLENLLEADPEDATGFFMLGKLLTDAGRHQEAALALERCIALKPDYSAAYKVCGDAYRKNGETEKARDVYSRGVTVAEQRGDLQTVKEMKSFLGKM